MRAISMRPHDATAAAEEMSRIVTTDWCDSNMPPSVLELVAIHAAERFPADDAEVAMARQEKNPPDFAGSIIAVGKAGHWRRVRYVPHEQFLFRLDSVRKLKSPISIKGALGFWPVDLETEQRIWDDLGEPMPRVRG